MIDHLVLMRTDGSKIEPDDVQASGNIRQLGAVIELKLDALEVIRARITGKDDQTTLSRIGSPYATGQLKVWAVERP
jgi:hypothetical protein